VRVRIPGLDRLLILGQLGPPVHLVVLVPRTFREHRPEHLDVGHHTLAALVEPAGDTGIEIARSRVEGTAQRTRVGVQHIAEPHRQGVPHVDDIDAGSRREVERQLERTRH
jgi:hypothetical protein